MSKEMLTKYKLLRILEEQEFMVKRAGIHSKYYVPEIGYKEYTNIKNLQGITFRNIDFSRFDLSDTDFSGSTFESCGFNRCNLSRVNFNKCSIKDCNFFDANFKRAKLTNCKVYKSYFSGSIFYLADFSNSEFNNSLFKGVDFNMAELSTAKFNGCSYDRIAEVVFSSCPEEGTFIGWASEEIDDDRLLLMKVLVPTDAQRVQTNMGFTRISYCNIVLMAVVNKFELNHLYGITDTNELTNTDIEFRKVGDPIYYAEVYLNLKDALRPGQYSNRISIPMPERVDKFKEDLGLCD